MNLNQPLPAHDDGTAAGIFVRVPECGPERGTGCRSVKTRNDAYHVQEVINGTRNDEFLQDRAFWFYLLDQGIVHAGTANSDSHYLRNSFVGSPRNIVYTTTTVADFDPEVFNQAVREGRMFGTNGPIIEVATNDSSGSRRTPCVQPFQAAPDTTLEIAVSAAPWVPVSEIRVYANGQLAKTITAGLSYPPDPFGTDGILRYQGEVHLSQLLPAGNRDAYIVVEAGLALPLHGDLNEDGVPETGDNNEDGRVDINDVKESRRKKCKRGSGPGSCGPLEILPDPENESDPRFHFNSVTPQSYPLAFTNPLLIDRDGDGVFTGPGLPGGGE